MEVTMKLIAIALFCLVLQYVCWFVVLPVAYSQFQQMPSLLLAIACNAAVLLGCLSGYVCVWTVYRYFKGRL